MFKTGLIRTLFIIAVGITLLLVSYNFYWKDIKECGLYSSDEGYYVQLARTYFYAIKYVKQIVIAGRDLGGLEEYITAKGGPFFNSARQGYIFLLSGIPALFLKEFYFYHGLQWSALFGIFSIFLVYIFAIRNLGIVSAAISTVLFALSSIHITFARSVHPTTISVFFLILGIIFYFESYKRKGFLKFAAMSFALAFSCHYNLFWIFPVVLIAEAKDYVDGGRQDISRIKKFVIFSVIPLILLEALTLSAQLFLQRHPYFVKLSRSGRGGYLDYFSDLFLHFIIYRGYSEVEGWQPLYYFDLIAKQHSLIFVVLFLVGLTAIVRRLLKDGDKKMFFLTLLFLPFIFYSLISNKADKMIVPFIPILCIYVGMVFLVLRGALKALITLPLLCLIFYQFNMSQRCLKYRMDISGALEYMRQEKGIKHISSQMYNSQAYVGKQNAIDDFFFLGPEPGESGKEIVCLRNLQSLYDRGFHYYLRYYDSVHKLARIARNINAEISYNGYYNVEGHYKRIPNLSTDLLRKTIEIYDVKKIIDYLKHFDKGC